MVALTTFYFFIIECLQLAGSEKKRYYFYDIRNLFVHPPMIANFAVLYNELKNREIFSYEVKFILVAYAVLYQWYSTFYWMRVFKRPAFFILLIKRTIFGIIPFMILLFIILFLFSNILFIFNKSYSFNLYDPETLYPDED